MLGASTLVLLLFAVAITALHGCGATPGQLPEVAVTRVEPPTLFLVSVDR